MSALGSYAPLMSAFQATASPYDQAVSGAGAPLSSGSGTGQSSGSSSSSSSPVELPGMMQAYQQLLGLNQSNYGNVMNAYSQGQSNINNTMPGITAGYGSLNNNVQNTLGMGQVLGQNGNWGVAQPAATAIGQAYDQNLASNTQNMTNAGLGNTTVTSNLQNQATLGASQAYAGLGAQLAQTAAGYDASIGQAGLGAQMQGLQQQTGLSQAQGGALAGYQFSNTAGQLYGQQSNSSSTQQSSNQQQQQSNPPQNPNNNPTTSGNGGSPSSSGSPGSSPYTSSGGGGGSDPNSGYLPNYSGGGVSNQGPTSSNFSAGTVAGQGAANYPTTGITGGAQVLGGQSGFNAPGSNNGTPNSPLTTSNPGGLAYPGTTGIGGGVYGQPMGSQAPNAMSANPYSQPSSQDYGGTDPNTGMPQGLSAEDAAIWAAPNPGDGLQQVYANGQQWSRGGSAGPDWIPTG